MNFVVYLCKNISNQKNSSKNKFIVQKKYSINNLQDLLNIPHNNWILSQDHNKMINLELINIQDNFIWLIDKPYYPLLTAQELDMSKIKWIAKAEFIKKYFKNRLNLLSKPFQLLKTLIEENILTEIKLINPPQKNLIKNNNVTFPQTILAIIPHLNCNQWLNFCLLSLVNQTIPLTNIVVVDDNSKESPEIICKNYPQVTLLKTSESVGPYQIIQSVIKQTNYDVYLFQDADDWSTSNRLETVLTLMNETNADLVGTQEYRVDEINQITIPVTYPLDVNLALKEKPGHGLLHPTSLIRRSAILKLNGFANGLLFGGDTEFLLRAHFHLKILNSPEFCYFRRKRVDSLTTSPITGLDSVRRKDLLQKLKQIAQSNYDRIQHGKKPLMTPFLTQKIIKLRYITGINLKYI
ncbi:beta-1,3-glucosyltransferase [Geminocystis sp. NIES-3708]|uniref:glycosyltransferase family 2 protein n=1 Tax=Geminocystis sp. NIES-3708 TaxID=1615909 RepID=UPI0005FC6028|nr:glycosyltransferase family 2 protein [Geminocystis sp. NIES-3708]BAQ62242.1 beta-1,3-glucosyltransferase [Geminocystis sp. NIES-3708]